MIRRSTWMVIALFAVLAGLAWWAREQKQAAPEDQAESEPTATPMPRLLPDLEPADVERIVLEEPATGRRVVLVRVQATPTASAEGTPAPPEAAEPQWRVEEPADAEPPEAWRVNGALESLVYARILATLPADTDPATVGLAGPAQRILLQTRDGRTITLWIGVSTPLQNGYYLRVDEKPDIVAVGQYGIGTLWELLDEIAPLTATPTPSPTP